MIQDFLLSPTGQILLAIIWGLGLSTLFRRACIGRLCHPKVVRGPDPVEFQKKTFHATKDKCFKYKTVATSCTA